MDLAQWRRHIDYVVETEGQWVGLLDENGWPLLDFPAVVNVQAPETRMAASSVEVTADVSAGGGRRLLDELVADGLGKQEQNARLTPAVGAARFICLTRQAGERIVARVVHTVVAGGASPVTMAVHGTDLTEGLAWWPCPSAPQHWRNAQFSDWTTDASYLPYRKTRSLAKVQFATDTLATTKRGTARDLIRDVIQDAFDTVNAARGWSSDPHAYVDYGQTGRDTTPEVLIRLDDSYVWDTVAATALQSGVTIQVDLWWPGDAPVRVRSGALRTWPHPVQIVKVRSSS